MTILSKYGDTKTISETSVFPMFLSYVGRQFSLSRQVLALNHGGVLLAYADFLSHYFVSF